ncbi:mannitol dehydrogenase family protein [Methylobacterium frigidaeris]|uniref:mannitol dehydrogenase family protein n=1 Tax=Methylobacterium frigidaeris TaxID=2038277 RepID=UPI001EDDFC7F|nr:mannitol dehydrogenase family protein [Methylobacterium frigidaeris]
MRRPGFEVAALRPGILHLGCGAFHRAHQAVFTQRAIEAAPGPEPAPWGIVATSLVRPVARNTLHPQDGLYTVLERGPDEVRAEIVGTVREVVFVPDAPAAVLARFTDPAIQLVTLTITASAYCLHPSSGRICPDHPAIQRDLHSGTPSSALGVLVSGLAEVRKAGRRPPAVMSCDNLESNGRTLRQAAVDYAALRDDGLANWIAHAVQFPSSMVDRIVPAATVLDAADATALLGLGDDAAVSAEPFRQWVIEAFEGPRPLWEAGGAEFVTDVAPWEASKLRLLNGTHMAIAYLGTLAGLGTVASFVADPLFADYARRFMLQEQMPTLPPSGHDIEAYAHQLLERWRNPNIAHQLSRVGRNGSQKLQPRLLASLRDNLRAGRPVSCTLLAIAAWICCASGASGPAQAMEDPLAGELTRLSEASGDDLGRLATSVLQLEDVFGCELPRLETVRTELADLMGQLRAHGVHRTVANLLG